MDVHLVAFRHPFRIPHRTLERQHVRGPSGVRKDRRPPRGRPDRGPHPSRPETPRDPRNLADFRGELDGQRHKEPGVGTGVPAEGLSAEFDDHRATLSTRGTPFRSSIGRVDSAVSERSPDVVARPRGRSRTVANAHRGCVEISARTVDVDGRAPRKCGSRARLGPGQLTTEDGCRPSEDGRRRRERRRRTR